MRRTTIAQRRNVIPAASLLVFALVLGACSMRQADVQTNTISAANPTALHTTSDTGITRVGLVARDGRCDSTFGGHPVRACRYFYKAFLSGSSSPSAVVPAGADTNPALAAGDITPPVGPVNVESPKITLQPQVNYRTQACAYVDYSDDGATGFQGPFCAGRDTNADGKADLNTFGPEWMTRTDPSGHAIRRSNGLMLHWGDTSTERHVDVGNCIPPSLLSSEPGLAAGFNELSQFNVSGRMLVRNVACDAANQEVRAYSQDLGDNGLYGRAEFTWYTSSGHFVFDDPDPDFPNPAFFVNEYYVVRASNFDNENVVKHEIGHNLGLAHDDRLPVGIMQPLRIDTSEVDQRSRNALSFLYAHTDAEDLNSGDKAAGAPDAGASSPDPIVERLRREGVGSSLTLREGAYETVKYINHGDKMTAQSTVYARTREGRDAAAAAASAGALAP